MTEVIARRVPNRFPTNSELVRHPPTGRIFPTPGRKRRSVLLLVVCFTYPPTANGNFVGRIAKHINAPFKAAMHSKLGVALVIQTNETQDDLMNRLRPILEGQAVETAWCYTPCENVASLFSPDPLTERIKEAWKAVNAYNNPPKRPSREQILMKHRADNDPAGAVRRSLFKKRPEAE